ncbi:sigma-70 family RNA polymerase sigma factor [Mesonia sp. K4-1]|uniref:sigma-70 family RNA polymerase sigma factor n=1 Tax=Mesonia sp. K4-1 TaxID=2602760 RepID=UPI0011C88BD3|nr:sigma-70 family RNA polymerase sigma factor [Mesonia sp. K4-1]TXK75528.1 sigma-70 family RNA polymerase sigma factor [Mesonia sp. K4-1]TXK75547.1 sigma-70 family RNA polymerase sigma factor [Mesonia sp. K4-1]
MPPSKENQINPEKWVDRYSDFLFNYTITRVNNRDIAKDLISETFLAGLKSMKNFKGEATERTWLVSILKRKIIDYYRKINSNKGKAEVKINYNNEGDDGDWLEEKVADHDDITAEDNLMNDELKSTIFNCLSSLPKQQAKVFKMKTIDNYDTEVICNDLNISPSNLWVIIHRARKKMADCMEDKWL